MTTKCINHRAGHVSDGHGVCAYCGATLTKKAVVTDNPTPGPHRQYGQFVTDTSDTLGGMFVIRTTADAGSEFLGAAQKQADAKLWAAASELLAALTAAVQAHGPFGDDSRPAWWQAACAAIAKAEAAS